MDKSAVFVDETSPLLAKTDVEVVVVALEDDDSLFITPEQAVTWRGEASLLLSNSVLLAATCLLTYSHNLAIIWVASRLGTRELAAVSLGMVTMNITGYSVIEGVSTSLDTLCAQAYGAGNKKLVGLHVQRMVLLLLLVCLPIGLFWICSPWVLAFLVPQKDLPALAGQFLRVAFIGLPGYAMFESGKRFSQAQGNFTAGLAVLVVSVPVNLMLNYVFVLNFDWGIIGAALAAALSNTLRPLLLMLYFRFVTPEMLECWPAPGPAMLQNWAPMVWLSIPGTVMTVCEWFSFEILTFTTSYLGITHLAAQTFLSSTAVLIWHNPFSAGIALNTRIGQLIGCGAVEAAKKSARINAYIFALLGCFDMAVVYFTLHGVVLNVFIQDPDVRAIVERTVGLIMIYQILEAMTCYVQGVARGLGIQRIVGWVSFGIHYTYAVPLAIFLELGPPRMGVNGIWTALGSGLLLLVAIEGFILKSVDWERSVDEAKKRDEDVSAF